MFKINGLRIIVVWISGLVWVGPIQADWPQFLGPNGDGKSAEKKIPLTWSETGNLVWKTPMPGPGNSSPIVSGGRIYLTSYSGYGVDRSEPGELENLKRHLVCVDAAKGRIVWSTTLGAERPEDRYQGYITEHGYASNTAVTDGERVYAFFGKSGVVAYDLQGKQLWKVGVGRQSSNRKWGSAASLILHKDLVIVNAAEESRTLRALEKTTGKEKWKADADSLELSFGTPKLVTANGRTDLLIAVPGELWGMNPDSGKLRWYGLLDFSGNISPSVVVGDGVAYAFGGYPRRGSAAFRLGGKGDVSDTHEVWKTTFGPYVPTPVLHEKHLYWVNREGIAYCVKADSGKEVYKERLKSAGAKAKVYASPVLIGDKLYCVSRNAGTFILEAKPAFKQLAQNRLEEDQSQFNASPAVSGGRLFIRSNTHLYCIAHN